MLIGSDFNKKCEKILKAVAGEIDYREGEKVPVEMLARDLKMDRVEIRTLFQYMVDLDLIKVESIGGPTLYGHISLTQKGVLKAKKLSD